MGHATRTWDRIGAYRVLVGDLMERDIDADGMDNIKIDLQVVGWGSMDWYNVAQERDKRRALVSAVTILRVH